MNFIILEVFLGYVFSEATVYLSAIIYRTSLSNEDSWSTKEILFPLMFYYHWKFSKRNDQIIFKVSERGW